MSTRLERSDMMGGLCSVDVVVWWCMLGSGVAMFVQKMWCICMSGGVGGVSSDGSRVQSMLLVACVEAEGRGVRCREPSLHKLGSRVRLARARGRMRCSEWKTGADHCWQFGDVAGGALARPGAGFQGTVRLETPPFPASSSP